jgi:arsenate reductase
VTVTPEVLFVCVHNAGRSQMAAGLLNHYANGRVVVRSAGSAPADSINPAVVEAMTELGIDIAEEFPKPLTEDAVHAADVVVTMGCGDACPIFPGKRYLDWALDDPAGADLDTVRRIRDQIGDRVRGLLIELTSAAAPPRGQAASTDHHEGTQVAGSVVADLPETQGFVEGPLPGSVVAE